MLATRSRCRTRTARCSTSSGGTDSRTSHGLTTITAATSAPTHSVAISRRFSSAVPTAWAAPDGGPATAMAPATSAVLTVKNTSSPAASTSAPSPAGRPRAQPGHHRRGRHRGQHEHRRRVRLPVRRHPGPDRAPPQVPVHDDRAQPGPARRQQRGGREEPDRRHVDVQLASDGAAAEALGIAAQLGVQHRHDDEQRRGAQRRMRVGRGPEARGRQQQPAEHEQHRTALHGEQRRDQRGGEAPQLPLPEHPSAAHFATCGS